jgi:hypothetical protein
MELCKLAKERADLVRRLFAVTVSVGFAAQLTRIVSASIIGGQLVWPKFWEHWHELVLLFISMVAVVGSWEGYLISIERTPLKDRTRFYIDVAIVFSYLILMLSSPVDKAWLWALAAVFVLYTMWDIASIRARAKFTTSRLEVAPLHMRSLSITILWLIFFVALALFSQVDDLRGFFCASLAALLAVVLYRVDKHRRPTWPGKIALLAFPVILLVLDVRH